MINFIEKQQRTRIPLHDYTFEKEEMLQSILDVLTPKIEGVWTIALIEPKIKFVNEFLDEYKDIPYITLDIYLGQAKLDAVLLKHPKLMPKKQTYKEAFLTVISEMKNQIDHAASKYLFKACRGDVEQLSEVLTRLDAECTTGTINVADAKQACTVVRKPLYASQVYRAFMSKDRQRWNLLYKLELELGTSFAYYALRKQAMTWLEEKGNYLNNEDTKNRDIGNVDGAFICYAYVCFMNSNNPNDLYMVMYDIDNRGPVPLGRRIDVNLQ